MNKQHWNSVKADGNVPDEILMDLLERHTGLCLGASARKSKRRFWEMSDLNEMIS